MAIVKIFHELDDGTEREIEPNAVDYGDGTFMVMYKDDGDVAIVKKSDLIRRTVNDAS